MFTEAVNHALHFICLHSDQKGCLSSDLGEFIETDVLPLAGWAPNATLRDTVAYLTLRDHYKDVVCYELPPTYKYKETIHVKAEKMYYKHTELQTLVSVKRSENPLPYEEMMKELDAGTIAWTADPPPPPAGSPPLKVLRICATVAFQSTLLGLPLHLESILQCSRFMMVAAIAGLHHVSYAAKELTKITEKPHLIPSGFREMRRQQWLFPCFIWTHVERTVQCLYFPFYAMPKTAADQAKRDNQQERRADPIEHYFTRKRKEMGLLDCVLFDPNVVLDVVRNSPEQQMLWEDAIHAIFVAHNLSVTYNSISKHTKKSIELICSAAGLTREWATVPMLGRTARVSILRVRECRLGNHRQPGSDASNNSNNNNNADTANESVNEDPMLAEEVEDVEEDVDDNGVPIQQKRSKNERALAMSRIMEHPVYLSPQFPLCIQAAQEASRRPFTTTVVLPQIRSERVQRSLNAYLETCATSHHLDKGYVTAKQSRSFTTVFAPPGFLGAAPGESSGTPLPEGLSRFAVDKVLHALETSPYKALTIHALSTVIDTKAVNLRVIPYLKSIGKVTTTSIRETTSRRVGIVVLAGHTLSEEDKLKVGAPTASSKATAPVVQLEHLPDPGLIIAPTSMKPTYSGRTLHLIDRIIAIRNGYVRSEDLRACRLHLELWKQWHDRCVAEGAAPQEFNARIVLENMSLSTFCVVIGFAACDLSTYMQNGGTQQRLFEWDTPLKSLPPSVYEQCLQQSTTPLLRALSTLQERELLTSEIEIAPFGNLALHHIHFRLEEQGAGGRGHTSTYAFYTPSYTPASTAYMVLQYWAPYCMRRNRNKEVSAVTRLLNSGCTLAIPQLIALSMTLRMKPVVLAEAVYQPERQCLQKPPPTKEAKARAQKMASAQQARRRPQAPRKDIPIGGPTFSRKLQVSMHHRQTDRLALRNFLNVVDRRARDRFIFNGVQVQLHEAARGLPTYNRIVSHEVHLSHLGAAIKTLLPRETSGSHRSFASFTPSSMSPQQRAYVQSVCSPDVRVPAGAAKIPLEEKAHVDKRLHTRAPSSIRAVEEAEQMELVMDCLRSVLLSDASHYDAMVSTSLLTSFPSHIISKARATLQGKSAFRLHGHGNGAGRIPQLHLRTTVCFTIGRLVRQSPATCANMWLLHNVYASAAQQSSVFGAPPLLGALSSAAATEAQVCVEAQERVDITAAVKAVGRGLRLLSKTHLPSLAWPPAAARAEALRDMPTERAHRKRRRDAAEAEDGDEDWQSDAEAEEDRTHLYPSRVLSCGQEEQRLAAIPVDAPPHAEDKAYVQLCVQHLREGTALPPARGYLPSYPSIFYHIDGAFHRFVWCAYLVELYHYLLSMPGVLHSQLSAAMTESGMGGLRDLAAAMHFLVDNGVVRRYRTMKATACSPFGGGGGQEADTEWAYETTVLPDGLWNLIDLDSCVSSRS